MVKAVRMVGRFGGLTAVFAVMGLAGGCTALRSHQGYIIDADLVNSVQPGVDNRASVLQTLGKPSFASQFNAGEWYYVARDSRNLAYLEPEAKSQLTLKIAFDQQAWCRTSRAPALDQVAIGQPLWQGHADARPQAQLLRGTVRQYRLGRRGGRRHRRRRRQPAVRSFRAIFCFAMPGLPRHPPSSGRGARLICGTAAPRDKLPRDDGFAPRAGHLAACPNPCSNLTDAFATGSVSPS